MYYWNKDDFAGLEVLADYVSMHCPHTAGLTFASRERLGEWAAAQLIDVLNGKRPPRLINPDAWALFEERYEKLLGPAVGGSD